MTHETDTSLALPAAHLNPEAVAAQRIQNKAVLEDALKFSKSTTKQHLTIAHKAAEDAAKEAGRTLREKRDALEKALLTHLAAAAKKDATLKSYIQLTIKLFNVDLKVAQFMKEPSLGFHYINEKRAYQHVPLGSSEYLHGIDVLKAERKGGKIGYTVGTPIAIGGGEDLDEYDHFRRFEGIHLETTLPKSIIALAEDEVAAWQAHEAAKKVVGDAKASLERLPETMEVIENRMLQASLQSSPEGRRALAVVEAMTQAHLTGDETALLLPTSNLLGTNS